MKALRYFDSHAHLDSFAEDGSLSRILESAAAVGVCRIVAIGGSATANQNALDIAGRYPGQVQASLGFDRDEAGHPLDWGAMEKGLSHPGVVAVGETGLDYHYAPETAELQKALLRANLDRAAAARLPVVIHTRDADEDTVAILGEHARRWVGQADRIGVIHCFTGSLDLARRLLDLGFYISFSGIVSFKKSEALREVARGIPADRLLVETDAPYLAPVPHRGRRNEPQWVVQVAEALATARNDTLQDLAERTWVNASYLFDGKE